MLATPLMATYHITMSSIEGTRGSGRGPIVSEMATHGITTVNT